MAGTSGTQLSYYKSDEAFRKKEAPLGTVALTAGTSIRGLLQVPRRIFSVLIWLLAVRGMLYRALAMLQKIIRF